MTKFILDSGIVEEYKEVTQLAKDAGSEIWGATTNPSLIAKNMSTKITRKEASTLHKDIVLQLLELVPGAVSAEVYADKNTKAEEMITEGQEIATWHERIVVKLPTTIEGFKARTELRKAGIITNNTLVFSQQQIFAICLHEQLITHNSKPITGQWPPFISPFVGRLDDKGLNGMDLVKHGMKLKSLCTSPTWMLVASVRNLQHFNNSLQLNSELITAPAKIYKEYFSSPSNLQLTTDNSHSSSLKAIPYWTPNSDLLQCATTDDFMKLLTNGRLDISHELTTAGIDKFAADWNAVITD